MDCPDCGRQLSQVTTGNITVEACRGGCGGIWFDHAELKEAEDPQNAAGEALIDLPRDDTVEVDRTKRRTCPKCRDVVMMRHFSSVRKEVTVDECPECGGYWLDVGELARIRSEFGTEEERQQAAERYFSEMFEKDLSKIRERSLEENERARKIARMVGLVCPEYSPAKKPEGKAE
jgi:Zn-finger nucleic acid-binding protein